MERILKMNFASIYQMYLEKVERKGRTKQELDTVIYWLTGYDVQGLQQQLDSSITVGEFFDSFPQLNANAHLVKGVICGYRVEEIADPIMKKIRILDKLVDELAKGKVMEKILRT